MARRRDASTALSRARSTERTRGPSSFGALRAAFIKVTQKAFAECVKTPDPCIKALVEANGALLYDNELLNWHLVTILMNDETSRTMALGWHDDKRMESDYKLVDEYLKMEKPYDVKTAYTNEFLDKSVKMPPINPPKLY